ncbi:MAG: hypothetical protein H8E84_08325 [Flavobacteriales bacterium]|nr:hypothetical protein [Flavobacteriales bacterium]
MLISCGPKKIESCDYKKVAEEALEDESRYIWSEYNGKINYLGAHVLNKSESLTLLELEEYHEDLENYSEIRKAIDLGYPVIELYYNFAAYSKQVTMSSAYAKGYYTWWQYEGNLLEPNTVIGQTIYHVHVILL